jgi:hypothetical protein
MSTTLERRVLLGSADVLSIEIQFGSEVSSRLRTLVRQPGLPTGLADSIANTAMHSRDAFVEIRFLRDIGLGLFVQEARRTARRVCDAGVIDETTYKEISRNLPVWYSPLRNRGIKKNDRMSYRILNDTLRTVYRGESGEVYLDQINHGSVPRLTVLGGYFVEQSDFRDGLINSYLRTQVSPSGSKANR